MNREEVTQLLAAASTVDQMAPQPGELVLRIWSGLLADIPMAAAEKALWAHYRATSTTITPADIVTWYRDRRRHAPEQRQRPPLDPELIRSGVDRVMTAWAQAKAITAGADPEEAGLVAESNVAARRSWRGVACPHCHARVGQPCTVNGRPLSKSPAHPLRLDAAFKAAGVSSPR
jgi:hypothetical protein